MIRQIYRLGSNLGVSWASGDRIGIVIPRTLELTRWIPDAIGLGFRARAQRSLFALVVLVIDVQPRRTADFGEEVRQVTLFVRRIAVGAEAPEDDVDRRSRLNRTAKVGEVVPHETTLTERLEVLCGAARQHDVRVRHDSPVLVAQRVRRDDRCACRHLCW